MAKKLTKKTARKVHRKSWFEKIFTFPALVIAAFTVLSILTVYLITKPSHGVQGVSTSSLYEDLSDQSYSNSSSSAKSDYNSSRYLNVRVFKDTNGDGIKQSTETCPLKEYTVVINGVTKTKIQKPNCGWNHVDLGQECNTVRFTADIKKYSYSEMIYTDKNGKNHYTKEKSISFCGGQAYKNGWNKFVSIGQKPK
jgi:hypothetical protein